VRQLATTRAAGVTRSIESHDRKVKPGHRARSREVSGGTASDDPSRSGRTRTRVRADHRERGERFGCGKQVASYLGLVPLEESSGNRRRLGHITKQGSSIVRFLLVETAQVTVRSLPEWRSKYHHLMMRQGRKTAKVAMAGGRQGEIARIPFGFGPVLC